MMLSVEAIEAGYGGATVLRGVEFDLGEGEALALIGRNGMGKTTTVRALFGLLPLDAGRIVFQSRALNGLPPYAIAQAGLGLVPEGRQAFPTLTVEENLVATAAARHGRRRWTLSEVFRLFPSLAERRRNFGAQLSSGEQQMLAIGRALMTNPKLIALDEATEGLAPLVRAEIWDCLKRLKAEGQSILVIDKNLKALVDLVDRFAVIEKGRIVWRGSSGRVPFRAFDCRTLSSCRRRCGARRLSSGGRIEQGTMALAPCYGGSPPRAHAPEFREKFDLQHALEIGDARGAAGAPLEADDALDRGDVVETPAPKIILEVDQFFRELVEVPVMGGVVVDHRPRLCEGLAFDMRLRRLGPHRGVADVETAPEQEQDRLLIEARLGEDRVEFRNDLRAMLVRF